MSTVSSELSQASTKVIENGDAPAPKSDQEATDTTAKKLQHAAESTSAQDILLFLIAFRILNALCVRTFFQPDEFFQSLEPAWQMAFGSDSGAWITWEWRHHLRSAIHPAIFAGVYYISDFLANLLRLPPLTRADLLIEMPKVTQALFAALGDYYTWKLAERIYGKGSAKAFGTLALTVVSPWQWFCSTRTLSNCLETTLTIIALYLWPWQWSLAAKGDEKTDDDGLRITDDTEEGRDEEEQLVRLRRCLLLAALACILRPTNLLIWLCLVVFTVIRPSTGGWLVRIPWVNQHMMFQFSTLSLLPATKKEKFALLRQSILCGGLILGLAAVIDRLYYQTWTIPPLRFVYFNVVQSLAIFYGKNDWHYYISQGYPLLLTTALPFAVIGVYQAFSPPESEISSEDDTSNKYALPRAIGCQLAAICLIVPAILSLIPHKEVRFIYPLLPLLHILASPPLTSFFSPFPFPSHGHKTKRARIFSKAVLTILLSLNVLIASYTTIIHNKGPLSVLSYLRHEHAAHYLPLLQPPSSSDVAPIPSSSQHSDDPSNIMTVGFLMPCHSTPWRSHLIFPSLEAWALSCEPPVNLNESERASYVDEADQFYDNPSIFLKRSMPRPPRKASSFKQLKLQIQAQHRQSSAYGAGDITSGSGREWPDYLIFFAQLESTMGMLLKGSGYGECWRGFNTHWHDDWRRKGDIVVWCLRAGELERDRLEERRLKSGKDREQEIAKAKRQVEAEAERKRAEIAKAKAAVQKANGKIKVAKAGEVGWWDALVGKREKKSVKRKGEGFPGSGLWDRLAGRRELWA